MIVREWGSFVAVSRHAGPSKRNGPEYRYSGPVSLRCGTLRPISGSYFITIITRLPIAFPCATRRIYAPFGRLETSNPMLCAPAS